MTKQVRKCSFRPYRMLGYDPDFPEKIPEMEAALRKKYADAGILDAYPEVGYSDVPLTCENEGTRCAPCFCEGPCVHEANPVCEAHLFYLEGLLDGLGQYHASLPEHEGCDVCDWDGWPDLEDYIYYTNNRVIIQDPAHPHLMDLAATYGIGR